MITTALFLGVLGIEGARRPGYDPAYHTGSELELGPGGLIQRITFLLMGAGMAAYAIGVNRVVDAPWAAIPLAVFASACGVSGVCTPDPVRGHPPGAGQHPQPGGPRPGMHRYMTLPDRSCSWRCLRPASLWPPPLGGGWTVHTPATAVAGLGLTAWTAPSYQRDAPNTGLVQRALLATYYAWIIVVGVYLASGWEPQGLTAARTPPVSCEQQGWETLQLAQNPGEWQYRVQIHRVTRHPRLAG